MEEETDKVAQSLPSTTPRLLYYIPGLQKWGGFWFMYPYNRTIVRRTQWLSQQADARASGSVDGSSGEPIYAKDLDYAECAGSGGLIGAVVLSVFTLIGAALFFGSSLVSLARANLDCSEELTGQTRGIMRMFLPDSGGGPSQQCVSASRVICKNCRGC